MSKNKTSKFQYFAILFIHLCYPLAIIFKQKVAISLSERLRPNLRSKYRL